MQKLSLSLLTVLAGITAIAACATDDEGSATAAETPRGFHAPNTPNVNATDAGGCTSEAQCPHGWTCSASGLNDVSGVCEEPKPADKVVDAYKYGPWSGWTKCDAECDHDGKEVRTRKCVRVDDGASAPCRSCGGSCEESRPCKGIKCCVPSTGQACDTGLPDGVTMEVPCPDERCVTARVNCRPHVTKHCYPNPVGDTWGGAPWVKSTDCSVSEYTFFNDFPCTRTRSSSSVGKVQCDGSCAQE